MAKHGTGNDRRLKWGDGWIEERATASGEPRWFARWRVLRPGGGTKMCSKSFHEEGAAEQHLRDLADRGAYRATPAESLTVAQVVTRWIDRGVHEWKPSTVVQYRGSFEHRIKDSLGRKPLHGLTTAQVQHWIDELVEGDLSPKSIVDTASIVKGAFKDAVRLGLMAQNVAQGVRLPRVTRTPPKVWTFEDVAAVHRHVADDPLWSAVYRLAIGTGMRPGELLALQWQDLDLAAGTVRVRRTMTRNLDGKHVIGSTTKTSKHRSIALSGSVVEALRGWRRVQTPLRVAAAQWPGGDQVLTDRAGVPLTNSRWSDHHAGIIAAAGVTTITLHGLRHTAATLMLERGVHPKIVSEILGHASIQITLDLYSHVSVDLQRGAVDLLDRHLLTVQNAVQVRERTS